MSIRVFSSFKCKALSAQVKLKERLDNTITLHFFFSKKDGKLFLTTLLIQAHTYQHGFVLTLKTKQIKKTDWANSKKSFIDKQIIFLA